MGLLNGSASVTRCRVESQPEEIDFESAAFHEIPPGSGIRERVGFLPVEPGEEYRAGQHRWAFRVRIDRVRPDATAVRERLAELVRAEKESTGEVVVSARKKQKLRQIAEEEILQNTTPMSKIIECCIDRDNLWIGSTSDADLGIVLVLLNSVGISAGIRTPWLDRKDPDPVSEIIDLRQDWQSVLGCRFLKGLLRDAELMFEPENGMVRLAVPDARISLSGAVIPEVLRYVNKGAELLAAKLFSTEYAFRFDAPDFRVSSLKMDTENHLHWADILDERLERIEALYDLLDEKYENWITHSSSSEGH